MAEGTSALHALDVLETRRIANLAAAARKVRDSLLEVVSDASLREPKPVRGEHNPAGGLVLNDVLAKQPEFVALGRAITELPRDMREKRWAVSQIGPADAAILEWDAALATGSVPSDDKIADKMVSEPDLESCLDRGLYELGAARPAGNVR